MKNVLKVLIATLILSTAGLAEETRIRSLVVEQNQVVSGQVTQATVNLEAPAPDGGFEVELWSGDSTSVPTRVIVPAGYSSVTFPIKARPVKGRVETQLAAMSPDSSAQAKLSVNEPNSLVRK